VVSYCRPRGSPSFMADLTALFAAVSAMNVRRGLAPRPVTLTER
jgi:hypothetical protein